jgi:hypothetical protein
VGSETKELGLSAGHDTVVLCTNGRLALLRPPIGAGWDRSAIDQAIPVPFCNQLTTQMLADLLDNHRQLTTPAVEAAPLQQVWEKMEPEAMDEGNAEFLIALEVGVADQGDGDNLAVAELWLGASLSPSPVATFQGFGKRHQRRCTRW